MSFEHIDLVYAAKSYGLIYLMLMSAGVLVYVFWPKNRATFDEAANRIIDDEDTPCQ